jgi:hypothetical protein
MVDDMTVGDDEPAARVEHHAGADHVNLVPSRKLPALRVGLRGV